MRPEEGLVDTGEGSASSEEGGFSRMGANVTKMPHLVEEKRFLIFSMKETWPSSV